MNCPDAVARLKAAGYGLALDGVTAREDGLGRLADFLIVDLQNTPADLMQGLAEQAKSLNQRLVAAKVETQAQFEQARSAEFNYFQGYFFRKPKVIAAREISPAKRCFLRFVQEVNRSDPSFERLENLIRQEVALSVKLLRYLNSPAMGLRHKITSIKQALHLLGERPLKKWASATAISFLGQDKPHELMVASMARGRFCEVIGSEAGLTDLEFDLYMLGSLSVLDALLDTSLRNALDQVPISPDVKGALLGEQTPFSDVYQLALAQEKGDWTRMSELAHTIGIKPDRIVKVYVEAVTWTERCLAI